VKSEEVKVRSERGEGWLLRGKFLFFTLQRVSGHYVARAVSKSAGFVRHVMFLLLFQHQMFLLFSKKPEFEA
jgi:hypothetical protein